MKKTFAAALAFGFIYVAAGVAMALIYSLVFIALIVAGILLFAFAAAAARAPRAFGTQFLAGFCILFSIVPSVIYFMEVKSVGSAPSKVTPRPVASTMNRMNNPAPSAAPAAPASPKIVLTGTTPVEKMIELKDMLDAGKITQEVYNEEVSKIL